MAASATPSACLVQRRLLNELAEAMRAIAQLQDAQMSDLIHGGDGLPRMDLALKRARFEWEKARGDYLVHLAEHGC